MEEKEEKEAQETKAPVAPKKEHPSWETELTLLLTLTRLSQPDLQLMLMMTVFLWTLLKLYTARQKVRERKRWLQQLLLQRSSVPATYIILVAVAPFCLAPSGTNTPRTSPRGPLFSSRSGFPVLPRRRRLVRSFKHTIW